MTRFSVFPQYRYYPLGGALPQLLNPEVLPYGKQLHVRVCFKDRSEWDLYEKSVTKMELSLLFVKNVVFLQKPTHIQMLITKEPLKVGRNGFFCLKAEGLFFHLLYCMFIYSKKNIFWKALNFGENHEKRWLATFLKNAGGEKVKMRPVDVNKENESLVFQNLYAGMKNEKRSFKFKVGDVVRISKVRGTFAKGYEQNYTEEFFTVAACVPRQPPVYRLSDYDREIIDGVLQKKSYKKLL